MDNMTTDELIIKLADLNEILNSTNKLSNTKLVLTGNEDQRDSIIDRIMIDEDIYFKFIKECKKINKHYMLYGSNIDFTNIVDKLIKILLKNYKLYSNVKKPKGHLIDYLFKNGFRGFPNRIRAMTHSYFSKFDETKTHKSLDRIRENATRLDKSEQDYFESNESGFDMEYHMSKMDKYIEQAKKTYTNELLNNLDEDEKTWYKEDNINTENESKPTTFNNVISIYGVNQEQLRMNNKYNLLTTEDFNEKLDELQQKKLKKWQKYRDVTGFLPHDISKYHIGYKYIPTREKAKNPDYIEIYCKPKEINFNDIFFDKTVETYLKNIIANKLSERKQLLIGLLYYKMVPIDDVVNCMEFPNKNALNKEKHRALKTIKLQLLYDYDFIIKQYDGTYLAYWVKLLKRKYDGIYGKVANNH